MLSRNPIITYEEEYEDTKGVTRIPKSKNTMAKRRKRSGQATIYKILHRYKPGDINEGQYEKGHLLIYLSHILPGQITCYCPGGK
jgi:hypothetical protein